MEQVQFQLMCNGLSIRDAYRVTGYNSYQDYTLDTDLYDAPDDWE